MSPIRPYKKEKYHKESRMALSRLNWMFTIRATYIPRDDMYFDKEYYISHHMPLAKKLLKDQVNYVSMHAEFDSCVMMNETDINTTNAFNLFWKCLCSQCRWVYWAVWDRWWWRKVCAWSRYYGNGRRNFRC